MIVHIADDFYWSSTCLRPAGQMRSAKPFHSADDDVLPLMKNI